MLIFFGLMLLGIEAKRQGLMSNENQKQLSSLVINIAYPALILSGVVGSGTRLQGEELVYAFFVALVVIFIVVVFGKLTPYLLGYEKKYHGIINVMVVFTNVGFMGLPMIQGILPDVPWKKALTNRPLLGFVLWKMLIFPTLALWGLSHFVSSPVLLAVALCALATPSGNMLAMLAAIYNKDSFLLATEGIALTTAVAVVTMPLVAFLVGSG